MIKENASDLLNNFRANTFAIGVGQRAGAADHCMVTVVKVGKEKPRRGAGVLRVYYPCRILRLRISDGV
jgi:hypothetical protein